MTTLQLPISPLADAAGGHRHGSPEYHRIVVGLMAGGLANFSLLYFVQPILPELADRFAIPTGDSAYALSVTTLTMTLGLILAGPLADRFGRVPVMRWSLLASGILGLAAAFAPTWGALLVIRGISGPVFAAFPAAALAYLREEVDAASHLRANASYIAGTATGGAIGRLLPGPLALFGGWTLASVTMSVITLAAAVGLWVLLPESSRFFPVRAEFSDALSGTLAATSDRVIALVSATAFAAIGAFVGVYNAVSFRLQGSPFDLGGAEFVVYLIYPAGIVAPAVLRRLAGRVGRPRAVLVAQGMAVIGVLLMLPAHLPSVMLGLGFLTFAFLGSHSLLSGWVVDRAQRCGRSPALASSAYLLAFYLGSTIAGALAVVAWERFGWGAVTVLCAGLAIAAGVFAWLAGQAEGVRIASGVVSGAE